MTRHRLPGRGAIRAALLAVVLLWLFGPATLRSIVPIWLPFLIALGLELHFFASGLRRPAAAARRRGGRAPEAEDRERYGFGAEADELLLVRDGDKELWIPYSGETGEELDALVAEARDAERRAPDARELPAVEPQGSARPLRRLLAGIVAIAAVAALAWLVDSRSGWRGIDAGARAEAEALFSREASRIVGRSVRVECDEAGDHVGAVQHADGAAIVGGDVAYLTPERCHDLYRLAFDGEFTFTPTARAIVVLAHEAWHLRGVADEGETHCYALQSGVRVAMRFGLTESTARRMMRQQLVENAARGRTRPEYLVSESCRDGGALDLDPGAPAFP